jgi:NADH:ubiquinone oxidoreductase subunit F (NADH-binding)
MNVPAIIARGPDWFAGFGTARSKGTKVFSVSGDVARSGVYELPMGSRLRELVVDLCGAGSVKMVQLGGAGGSILPARLLDTPLSYETVLGSGGVTVFDEEGVIDIVHRDSSSSPTNPGECTPAVRNGSDAEMLGRLSGETAWADLEALEDLSR